MSSSPFTSTDLLTKLDYFGNGSDGPVSYSDGMTHTLIKDMYYTTLTLTSGSIIYTSGYRIYASVVITGDGSGIIHYNGFDASGRNGGAASVGSTLRVGSSAGASGGLANTNGSTTAFDTSIFNPAGVTSGRRKNRRFDRNTIV